MASVDPVVTSAIITRFGCLSCDCKSAAEFLGIGEDAFKDWRARGIIRPFRRGRYRYSDLVEALEGAPVFDDGTAEEKQTPPGWSVSSAGDRSCYGKAQGVLQQDQSGRRGRKGTAVPKDR